jgi:hypothetical protein
MAKFTRIVNGVLRSFDESGGSLPAIYDEYLLVVSGSPSNGNEITGPILAGTNITLPNSGQYSGDELLVDLNGQTCENGLDFNYVGSPPRTQIAFTFDLFVDDRLYLRKFRNA